MSITLVNETAQVVNASNWELSMSYTCTVGGECTTNTLRVPENDKVDVELPKGTCDNPAMMWSIKLTKQGYKWKSSTAQTLDVVPSGVYAITLDDANPVVSAEDQHAITMLLLEEIQHKTPYNGIWSAVYAKAGDETKLQRTREQFIGAYNSVGNWETLYTPLAIETWATQEELDTAMTPGGEARLELYWRALDRRPGGNADSQTVCYTFDCSVPSVSCRVYSNWDGSQAHSEFTPQQLSAGLAHPADGSPPSSSFAALVKLLDTLKHTKLPWNSECLLWDNVSCNSEEYDTEWSSQEIVVFLPRKWSTRTHQFFEPAFRQTVVTFLLVVNRLSVLKNKKLGIRVLVLPAAAHQTQTRHRNRKN